MTVIAVLGAGAGGAAATAELIQKGFRVRLWNRSKQALATFIAAGSVGYQGVLGEGRVTPDMMSLDIAKVVSGADGILVCMPTIAHGNIAQALIDAGKVDLPIVLNPGHTGGALEFYHRFVLNGVKPPPIAEFSTLTYVARKSHPDTVNITGSAGKIRVAGMAGESAAVELARCWFDSADPVENVLATSLSNVNLVLHPPGSMLGAAWVESTGGKFTFYVEGMTDGVASVMAELDDERRRVAAAYGLQLPPLQEEMAAIGTAPPDHDERSLADNIRSGEANQKILAPDSLDHRYYIEDFWYGLMPFLALAHAVSEDTPIAKSLMQLAIVMRGERPSVPQGRGAEQMGIQGLNGEQVLNMVRGLA